MGGEKNIRRVGWFIGSILLILLGMNVKAQISPGELSAAHAHLKGISNCTKCHVLGEKETTSKCLECHVEIKDLQEAKKGYHASDDVIGKKCASCHGDHFGRDFNMINFDENSFDHNLTGYELVGAHEKLECVQCHTKELIKDNISQNTDFTYLGLGVECLSCHNDYHQHTLSSNCLTCHNQNTFIPATGFDHNKTKYPLQGKHSGVDCIECHKKEERNGAVFQQFANIAFSNCTDCHTDVHDNKFGGNCIKCHSVESFKQIKSLGSFDHNKTDFSLNGKHVNIDCNKCHLSNYTIAVKHDNCSDCHKDYHGGQFVQNESNRDCDGCHSEDGFTPSVFTIEQHNKLSFDLEGAHMATPCSYCHRPEDKWDFSIKGESCTNCHENIHKGFFDEKYVQNGDCMICHSLNSWNEISFDHDQTGYLLEGKHNAISCHECHFTKSVGVENQQFSWDTQNCTNCHEDIHNGQFSLEGIVGCENCHTPFNWEPTKFDHYNTRFKLDGEHVNVSCDKCHEPAGSDESSFVLYKFDDISCTSCHLQ